MWFLPHSSPCELWGKPPLTHVAERNVLGTHPKPTGRSRPPGTSAPHQGPWRYRRPPQNPHGSLPARAPTNCAGSGVDRRQPRITPVRGTAEISPRTKKPGQCSPCTRLTPPSRWPCTPVLLAGIVPCNPAPEIRDRPHNRPESTTTPKMVSDHWSRAQPLRTPPISPIRPPQSPRIDEQSPPAHPRSQNPCQTTPTGKVEISQ